MCWSKGKSTLLKRGSLMFNVFIMTIRQLCGKRSLALLKFLFGSMVKKCLLMLIQVLEFNQLDWIGSTSVKFFHYFTLGIIRQNHISSVLSSIQTNDCKIQKNTKYYCCLIQLQDGIWYKNRKTYKEVRRMLKMAENGKEGTKEVRKKDWTVVFPA